MYAMQLLLVLMVELPASFWGSVWIMCRPVWQYAGNAVLQNLGRQRQAGIRSSSGELFCNLLHYRALWRKKFLAQAQSQQPEEVTSCSRVAS